MSEKPMRLSGVILFTFLGIIAIFCGIHALFADSVTTPAKFGSGKRVDGLNTVLIGIGWILVGIGIIARAYFAHYHHK